MSVIARKETKLVLGASPRVDLLPFEVKDSQRGAAIRRLLGVGLIAIIVISGAGYLLASIHSIDSQRALDDARTETAHLLAEQAKYNEVSEVARKVTTTT
jgi:Na+-transporting NADH:ubiquinone oxidoreductase subunit NqrC